MAENTLDLHDSENVFIRAGDCYLNILPHLGGKIASIRIRDRELLQAPLAPVALRTHTMPFDASDASGWDECLPSVAGCTVKTGAGSAVVPDHGDLWRVGWEPIASGQDSIELEGRCFSLPLTLRRAIKLSKTAAGWQLQLNYELTNAGSHQVPWSWAAHPLFAVEPGDRIELPDTIRSLRVEGSAGKRLGSNGDIASWPIATLSGGGQSDLRIVQAEESGIGDKLFAGPLASTENWCALVRPKTGVRIRFQFDSVATPYLGLWICYGGWPERPGPKQMCVALEPCTAPVDSLAEKGPWSRELSPGQSYSWPLVVNLERIEV